jgi:hypothetical protein
LRYTRPLAARLLVALCTRCGQSLRAAAGEHYRPLKRMPGGWRSLHALA